LTRRFNLFLLALIVVVGAPFYWFFLDSSTDGAQAKPIHIAELRALANAIQGQRPTELRFEAVASRHVARDILAAGSGLREVAFTVRAYQLELPDGHSMTIDKGVDRETAKRFGMSHYSAMAQQRVSRAVAQAEAALTLSSIPLHTGGAITPASTTGYPPNPDGDGSAPLNTPYALAPGVVAIPTFAQSGDRMLFVKLANGHEYLFTGDVAPIRDSWNRIKPPARFASRYIRVLPRKQIVSWLMTINALAAEAPQLTVVAGHDGGRIDNALPGFVNKVGQGQAAGKAGNDKVRARQRRARRQGQELKQEELS